MIIQNKIKMYRKLNKMTQEDLANKLGVSKNTIWNYENDEKKKFDYDLLKKISEALGIMVSDLTLDKDERNELLSGYELLDPFVFEKVKQINLTINNAYTDEGIEKQDITETIENILIAWFAGDEARELAGLEDESMKIFKIGANGWILGSQLFNMLFNEYLNELKKDKRINAYIRLRELAEEENLTSPIDVLTRPIDNQELIESLKDYKKKYGISHLPMTLAYLAEFLEADTPVDPKQLLFKMLRREDPKLFPEEGE